MLLPAEGDAAASHDPDGTAGGRTVETALGKHWPVALAVALLGFVASVVAIVEDPRRGHSGGQLGDGLAVQVDGLHSAEGADVGVGIAIDDDQVRVVADAEPSLAVAQAAGAGRDRGG